MAEIQELSIKITAEGVEQSAQDIDKLTKSLGKLSKKLPDISNTLNNMNYEGLVKTTKALKDISKIDLSNLSLLGSLKSVASSQNAIKENAKQVAVELSGSQIEPNGQTSIDIPKTTQGVKSGIVKIKKLGNAFDFLGKKINSAGKPLSNIVSAIGRIALYRLIRTLIKEITSAISTGLSNIYQWSKSISGTFAKSMDSAASAALTLKNSIGAALAPLLQNVLIPLFIKAANACITFFNALSRSIAILSGAKSWYKAKEAVTEYASAVDKASKSLAGFDEINNIGNSSNNSTSGTSVGDMFEEVDLDGTESKLQAIADIFDSIDGSVAGIVSGLIALALKLFPIQALGVGLVTTGLVEFFQDLKQTIEDINNGNFDQVLGDIADCIGDLGEALLGVGFLTGNTWMIIIGVALSEAVDLLEPIQKLIDDLNNSDTIEQKGEAVGQFIADLIEVGFENYLQARQPLIYLIAEALGAFKHDDESAQELEDEMYQVGENTVKGFEEGAESEQPTSKESIADFFKGIIKKAKEILGIHSPSTVFHSIGQNLVQGMTNGVNNQQPTLTSKLSTLWDTLKTKSSTGMQNIWTAIKTKWNSLKTWWSSLSLGSFNIKLPHFSISSGYLGLPSISVDWYDKGTNYVAEDQLAMIHKGEAIVPSKYNQNPAYQPADSNMESLLVDILNAINDKDMNTYIDGNEIGKASVKYINKQSRLKGAAIV